MLGGSSGLNYMAYVRGHPGDFDSWAEGGATGWSYADVLPYFRKSEALATSDDVLIDLPAHGSDGPLGVSVRSPVLQGAREFVEAAEAAGMKPGPFFAPLRVAVTGKTGAYLWRYSGTAFESAMQASDGIAAAGAASVYLGGGALAFTSGDSYGISGCVLRAASSGYTINFDAHTGCKARGRASPLSGLVLRRFESHLATTPWHCSRRAG